MGKGDKKTRRGKIVNRSSGKRRQKKSKKITVKKIKKEIPKVKAEPKAKTAPKAKVETKPKAEAKEKPTTKKTETKAKPEKDKE